MAVSATVILASALLPATPRLLDLVGSRLPRANRVALANWVMSHLPVALAITAAGAGMVSLIGHAHDTSAPAGTSWLLAGAVATGLLALVLIERALADAERLSLVFHPLRLALSGGAAAALLVGLAATGPLAAGVAAGGDPLWGLVLCRQPLPARRRLGRTMTGALPRHNGARWWSCATPFTWSLRGRPRSGQC